MSWACPLCGNSKTSLMFYIIGEKEYRCMFCGVKTAQGKGGPGMSKLVSRPKKRCAECGCNLNEENIRTSPDGTIVCQWCLRKWWGIDPEEASP